MKKLSYILILLTAFVKVSALEQDLTSQKQAINYDLSVLPNLNDIAPIVIIGSGPAGLAAGLYAGWSKFNSFVIRGNYPGGQLMGAGEVQNIPGIRPKNGADIMKDFEDQTLSLGAEFVDGSVTSVDFSQWPFVIQLDNGKTMRALSVIITTGAAARKTGVPGEEEYWGRGVSVCAVCDAFLYQNKDVVIIGGGDAAIEQALHLAPYAKSITIFVRKDRMRAASRMQDKIRNHEKITIVYNKEITSINGDGDAVTSIGLQDANSGEITNFACDGVFLAIGHNPNTQLFQSSFDLSKDGYINLESRSQETAIPGIFAAGDVADSKFRQAIIAAGSGAQAALEAVNFLRDIGFTERIQAKIPHLIFKN